MLSSTCCGGGYYACRLISIGVYAKQTFLSSVMCRQRAQHPEASRALWLSSSHRRTCPGLEVCLSLGLSNILFGGLICLKKKKKSIFFFFGGDGVVKQFSCVPLGELSKAPVQILHRG